MGGMQMGMAWWSPPKAAHAYVPGPPPTSPPPHAADDGRAGELRAEEETASTQMTADLGLRQVPRPKAASTTPATEASGDNVEEVIERSPEGVTVRSDSPAQSVTL